MPSIGSANHPRGSVHVHDSDVLQQLTLESREHTQTELINKSASGNGRISRQKSAASSTGKGRTHGDVSMDSHSLIGQTMKVQDWLNEKTVKGLQYHIPEAWVERQERSDIETKEARKLYNPLLETEGNFVKDLEEYVQYKDVMDMRKKEMLHKKWNDRVYEPMRKNIIEVMDSDNWPELDRRKRELHKQYLEFTNQKGHVFLDTMDPEEYYAQALNGHRPAPITHACAKWDKRVAAAKEHFDLQHYKAYYDVDDEDIIHEVATRPLRDPLLSQGRQRSAEDRTILRCITGYSYSDKDIEQVKLPPLPLVPLGRHGTDSIRWLEMPLHNIESTPRIASRRRMHGVFNNSLLDFKKWENVPQNAAQIDREMQTQKKRMYAEVPPFSKSRKSVKFVNNADQQTIGVQTMDFDPADTQTYAPPVDTDCAVGAPKVTPPLEVQLQSAS